MARDMA